MAYAWPRLRAEYGFESREGATSALRLSLTYLPVGAPTDPDEDTVEADLRDPSGPDDARPDDGDGDAGPDYDGPDPDDAAYLAYRDLSRRLADPALGIALTTTLLPGTADDGTLLRPALVALVDDVLAFEGAKRVARSVAVPFDRTGLAAVTGDVVPVEVAVRFTGTDAPADVTAHFDGNGAGFAAAFAGFDGADGAAFVAVDDGTASVLRWSATKGASAAFGGTPAYFAVAPLSVTPFSGTVQVVEAYDVRYVPRYATGTFSQLDLALAAGTFAEVVERLAARFPRFAPARDALARALADDVMAVYGGGDLAAARDAVRAAALTSPTVVYGASAVVQVPATVTATTSPPPVLLGDVEAAPLTAPAAPLRLAAPAHLTFLATAPGAATEVAATVRYRPTHVTAGAKTLPLAAGPVLDAGAVNVPVPLRTAPAAATLVAQSATRSEGAASCYAWDYAATVSLDGVAAQDSLWLDVTYGAAPPPVLGAEPVPEVGAALAAFATGWPLLQAAVGATEPSDAVLGAVAALVDPVTEAWAALPERTPGPADPGEGAYEIAFTDLAAGVLHVSTRGPWPTVNGAPPLVDAADPTRATYAVEPPDAGRLHLVWPELDALTQRSAVASCRVVRNARLAGAAPVDAAFVYRTPTVTFATPAVPLLEVPALPVTPAEATLAATLTTALAGVAEAGPDRYVAVDVAYSYELGEGLRTSLPVLATRDVLLSAEAIGTLAATLAEACDAWFAGADPVANGALLELTVDVSDLAGQPVARFASIPVAVPDGWWMG